MNHETVDITINSEQDNEHIAQMLSQKIRSNGYTLSVEKTKTAKKETVSILQALPIGLGFLLVFFMLQKSGILNFGIGGGATATSSFVIGLVASVSSCLAVVGGLILSLSARVVQDEGIKSSKKQFILFHVGRLFGFALLGGLLGLVGQAIGINFTVSAILGIVASVVMILLGLNLIGVIQKNKITLPVGIFKQFRKLEHATLTPILVGIGTFFLPCGFTQSMQVAALSSGSFMSGMLIMTSFALGTLPVLGLLSFSSVSFAQSKNAPLFFKSAGIVVIGLGVFALLAGLAGLGIINPLFNI